MNALTILAALVLISASHGQTPSQTAAKGKKTAAAAVSAVLDNVDSAEGLDDAAKALQLQFDDVITTAALNDADSFRDTAFGVRLATQLKQAPREHRLDLLAYLRKNEALAQTLVFLVKPEDKPEKIYTLLYRLMQKHPDVPQYANLAAALCVVHDQPLSWRVNENRVDAPDPLEIFEYLKSEKRVMTMPVASCPAELLTFVVDMAASMDDLRWAGKTYARDPKVGQRYFDIKYDNEAFYSGAVKKVTAAGFSLRNVLRFGGVCADQAYFAAQVGKSIGVPTAYVFGRNAEVSHAWVGFLEGKEGKAAWNFDSGRYPGYQGVRGNTLDPQTRSLVPDSTLSLIADASGANAQNRRTAAAYTDAALRLAELAQSPTSEVEATNRKRGTGVADRLELLEAGLRKCPSYARGWNVLVAAAKNDELSFKEKKRWAEVLDRLCAGKHPDFSLDVLRPMIETVDDVREQDALWNSLFSQYQKRPDLAAEIRFAQGAMWEKEGNSAKAWACYQDVLQKFADDGPFTVDAAKRCEKLLSRAEKTAEIVPMYASLWAKLTSPNSQSPEFRTQSNWYRIGVLYSGHLALAGQSARADEVRSKLGVAPKK